MCKNLQPQIYVHGRKIINKANEDSNLNAALGYYQNWKDETLKITDRSNEDIEKMVDLLNEYKDLVEPIFDQRSNSAQEVLQPSILEEFFEYLFCQIDKEVGKAVLRKPGAGFVNLSFHPKDINELLDKPSFTINNKDHDFIIGADIDVELKVKESTLSQKSNIIIPAVALECKRYLERNMLDECSGTAEKVKRATPYCLYLVIAEYLKMNDASPELSKIDEIYVLRKQKNSDRNRADFQKNPIASDLIIDIYNVVLNHLKKVWWDPTSALTTGKAFNKLY